MDSLITRPIAAQVDGIDSLLFTIYGHETTFLTLIQDLGVPIADINRVYQHHIGDIIAAFLRLLELHLCTRRQDGPRMYAILCRRFGLDGQAPATLAVLGLALGISGTRVAQIEKKTLRSCSSRAARTFFEHGLCQHLTPFIPPSRNEIPPSPTTTNTSASRLSDETASDIEFIGGIAKAVVETIPDGLSCSILSHILVGHHGPIVDAVVGYYNLAQHGMLRRLGYERVKALVIQAGNRHPDLLLRNQKITARHFATRP